MRKREMYQYLEKVPLFSGLSQRRLGDVARVVDEIDVPSGAALVTEGELGRELFVIITGGAEVIQNGKRIAALGPGDVVGEMSLIDHEPRSATVVMTEDSSVFVISARAFKPLLESVPSLSYALLEGLCGRVRAAETRVV